MQRDLLVLVNWPNPRLHYFLFFQDNVNRSITILQGLRNVMDRIQANIIWIIHEQKNKLKDHKESRHNRFYDLYFFIGFPSKRVHLKLLTANILLQNTNTDYWSNLCDPTCTLVHGHGQPQWSSRLWFILRLDPSQKWEEPHTK